MIAAASTRSLTDKMEPSEGLDRGSIPLGCTTIALALVLSLS